MHVTASTPLPTLRARPVLPATLAATALGLSALTAFAVAGWPGTLIDCTAQLCYCEGRSPGLWRQPVNTWSNLAPLLAALAMAWHEERSPAPLPATLVVSFPVTLVAQGVGSMFFHASLVEWAGAVDAASMFAVAGLLLAVNLMRGGWLTERDLLRGGLPFITGGVALALFCASAVAPVVGGLFFAVLASEVWLHRRRAGLPAARFRAGLLVFMLGGTVWFGSAVDGMPLCEPSSPWQGHALWHATSAVAVCLFWLNARHAASPRAAPCAAAPRLGMLAAGGWRDRGRRPL